MQFGDRQVRAWVGRVEHQGIKYQMVSDRNEVVVPELPAEGEEGAGGVGDG